MDLKTFAKKKLRLMRNLYYCVKHHRSFWLATGTNHIDLSKVPEYVTFGHPFGIAIKDNMWFIGPCFIGPGVIIGVKDPAIPEGDTVIGNGVKIYAGAKIIGAVIIGDGATIGAGAIVLADVPSERTVVGTWKDSDAWLRAKKESMKWNVNILY